MARYLVTGASGFLGGHLVGELRAVGHEIVALCRTDRGSDGLAAAGAQVLRGDVLDPGSVRDAAIGCDGVFHCAGKVSRDLADADALFRVHVEGTELTLDACRAAGVRRAVVVSTSGVVAVSTRPDAGKDERAPVPLEIIAAWPYYLSKLYAERAALRRNTPGFEVVCVNPSLLLGPGDSACSSTADIGRFLEGQLPVTPAGGVAFVDVRDAALALRLAMDRGTAGDRYIVNAVNMTFEVFFDRLERVSGVPAPRLRMPRGVALARAGAALTRLVAEKVNHPPPIDRVSAEMAQHFWYADAARARRVLGWTPRDPMGTLADTVADLYARGVVWPRASA